MNDSALETLVLPFLNGSLEWPDEGALFLRAREGWPLRQRAWPGLICEQTFKPDAEALTRAGFKVISPGAPLESAGGYPLVLLLPPRQRDEARAAMVRAIDATKPGGRVMACLANTEGARSGEADLARLAGQVEVLSKNKCRVFWTGPLHGAADAQLAAEWREADAVRAIEGGRLVSRPGIFAWDRIDAASALLASQLPARLQGEAADLGAGIGYLAIELLQRCAGIARVDLYEAEARALDLARRNLASYDERAAIDLYWHDVTTGLPRSYDVIVTNPPFHAQRGVDRPDIGRRFIAVAAESLNSGGSLWLVANRHLPYESVLAREFSQVRTVAQQHGFKIVEAVKRREGDRRT